jgi:hypothetical protein
MVFSIWHQKLIKRTKKIKFDVVVYICFLVDTTSSTCPTFLMAIR